MESSVILRNLTENDINGVVEIEELCFTTPWTKGAFYKELENKLARYVVAEIDGKIAAYGGMWLVVDEGHITNIAVHPDFRGIGLGDKIVEAMIEECKKSNVISMTLEVKVSNYAAQSLYRKYGFKPSGIRPEYYTDTKEDALIMWKEL